MDFITSILKDFHECCNIPVRAITYKLNDLYKIGYNDNFDKIYPKEKIETKIINSDEECIDFDLDIDNNLYYKILSISKINTSYGYFIIGPLRKNIVGSDKDIHIPYKSKDCVNYISRLILDIYNDKFNKRISSKSYNPYIRKAIEYVHENYNDEININTICEYLKINKCYFCSLFKKTTGQTFSNFLNCFRIEKSKSLLIDTNLTFLDIAITVGFNNQNYFSMVFKKYTDFSPSQYRTINS